MTILPKYGDNGSVVSYLHFYEFELMKVPELVYVDSVAKLQTALAELRQHAVIAIDVEHHSYRSFQGNTCLVWVSTRNKDYLFGAVVLREDMQLRKLILTDPRVVKILHGADLDVEWLQRDLLLYIFNLIKHYCNLEADKTFQLVD